MSVLSFPRIYFKGFMGWDPCTFNNNDWQEFPTYDGANAALNWSFLATQGITPDNFTTTFRPWAIKLQQDVVDKPPGARIPAEWNMFGTHGVSFVTLRTVHIGPRAVRSPLLQRRAKRDAHTLASQARCAAFCSSGSSVVRTASPPL